jgi:hypothetical protein
MQWKLYHKIMTIAEKSLLENRSVAGPSENQCLGSPLVNFSIVDRLTRIERTPELDGYDRLRASRGWID